MSHVGRKTVDDSKAGGAKRAESQRTIEKEEITSTEFPEGGNTTSTKGPPASQQGGEITAGIARKRLCGSKNMTGD